MREMQDHLNFENQIKLHKKPFVSTFANSFSISIKPHEYTFDNISSTMSSIEGDLENLFYSQVGV
jgi:hypothetical protein